LIDMVAPTLHISDFSEEEIQQTWWDLDSITKNKAECRTLIEMYEEGYYDDVINTEDLFRGLEKHLNRNERNTRIALSRDAVLYEDCIADYVLLSEAALNEAQTRAQNDAEAVVKDQDRELDFLSSSISRHRRDNHEIEAFKTAASHIRKALPGTLPWEDNKVKEKKEEEVASDAIALNATRTRNKPRPLSIRENSLHRLIQKLVSSESTKRKSKRRSTKKTISAMEHPHHHKHHRHQGDSTRENSSVQIVRSR